MMKTLSVIALLFILSACATSGDVESMRQDINSLQLDSVAAKQELARLKEKTANTVKEDTLSPVRESQAEIHARLSTMASGLQDLRGRFEENKYNIEKALKDSSADRDILKAQIGNLESQIKSLKDKLASLEGTDRNRGNYEKAPEGQEGVEAPAAGNEEQASQTKEAEPDRITIYNAAYQAYKDRKYREAREKFENYINDYPKNDLTDNAQFWIGEAYYAEKDYENAILSYEKLLKKYPESDKTSGAMVKQGFAFLEMGDAKTGKAILERVIEKFPGSKEAALAKKKLAETEKKPARKK